MFAIAPIFPPSFGEIPQDNEKNVYASMNNVIMYQSCKCSEFDSMSEH